MDLERLKKFYRLATNNPNKNEAAIAALKFVEALEESNLKIHLFEGNPPPTPEQVQEALKHHFDQGYRQGRQDIMDQINRQQQRPRSTTIGTASNGQIYFY